MSSGQDWVDAIYGDTPTHHVPVTIPDGPGTTTPEGLRSIQGAARKLAATMPGERNDMLLWTSRIGGQLHAAGHLDADVAHAEIQQAAYACGLDEPEVRTTMRSGWDYGNQRPKAPIAATNVVQAAYRFDHTPPEGVDPGTGEMVNPIFDQLPQPLDWHHLWADDTEEEWIVEPILPARRLVALFSAPKVGKSLLLLELAAGIAAGRSLLGHPAKDPRRVLYVDYENDPRGDIRTRLQSMGYTPDDLAELVYLSYPVLGGLDTPIGAARLLAVVDRDQPDVVVIDTVSRAMEGEENSNDTWLNFYRLTGLALKQRGVAAIRLDHSGKDEEKGMRGGSAKYGDVDAVWHMRAITDNTLSLNLTHRRMRIVEDYLVMDRLEDPLRHHVQANPNAAVVDAKIAELMVTLDRLGVPKNAGRPTCKRALRDAGLQVPRLLEDAVQRRSGGLTVFEEDE